MNQFFSLLTIITIGMFVYVPITLVLCSKEDEKLLLHYKPSTKKVKDMTKQQKKYRKIRQGAKWRQKYYACRYTFVKVILFVSTIMSVLLYPYAKKKKSMPIFVLLVVVCLPFFLMMSATLVLSAHTNTSICMKTTAFHGVKWIPSVVSILNWNYEKALLPAWNSV